MPVAKGSTPFARIAVAVRDRVAEALGIDRSFVRIVASDDYEVTDLEPKFACVRFYGLSRPRDPAVDAENMGAGRLGRVVARPFRVYVHTRSGEDLYGGDEVALAGSAPGSTAERPGSTPGHLLVEEIVLNSLDDWMPTYADPDDPDTEIPMTIGPVRWIDAGNLPPARKPRDSDQGLQSEVAFEAVYVSAITPDDPPS